MYNYYIETIPLVFRLEYNIDIRIILEYSTNKLSSIDYNESTLYVRFYMNELSYIKYEI